MLDNNLSEKERRSLMILDALRRFGPLSRPQLSEKLAVNVVTISNYIDDFLKKNLILETRSEISEGGRKPFLLDLNPTCAYTIGIGVNLTNIVGVFIDAKGNILNKVSSEITSTLSTTDVVNCILETTRKLLQRNKEYLSKIKGIGVGIAGLINKKTGSIRWPQRIREGYDYVSVDIPLRDLMEKEFGLSTLIDNDATCACFGESWFDKGWEWKNILYMYSGVGCGIMFEGKIYRGAKGYAGEVSIHNYKESNSFNCNIGDPCFLKRWEKDLGMIKDLKEKLSNNKEYAKPILDLVENKIENINLKTIFTAIRFNNPLVKEILDEVANRLGIKIAFLVNFLNPEAVIIGGGLEDAGDDFLKRIIQTVKDWAFREAVEDLKIIYSRLKENASAYGAAALMMERFFTQA